MQPGSYTELFFLDEATALSAGHRPCGMCRKPQYLSFKTHWLAANGRPADLGISDVDKLMHVERMNRGNSDDWSRLLETLPAGVFVNWNSSAHLWNGAELLEWTPKGYGERASVGSLSRTVQLLTPPSVVNAIQAGYHVQMHSTACPEAPSAAV